MIRYFVLLFAVLISLFSAHVQAAQIDILGPAGSGAFGTSVVLLPNGNFVVTDPDYSIPGGAAKVGAVYLYSPARTLISTLTGSKADDQVGSFGVTVLTNGNYVVKSANWDNATIINAGAVTWCDGDTGINGVVSTTNSLVGGTAGDQVGGGSVTALSTSDGHYVVRSGNWSNGTTARVGAATWCNGITGRVGVVSAANSLVGITPDDFSFGRVIALTNGNYVVSCPDWDGAAVNVGAVTWCNGSTGVVGAVSAANSLVGSQAKDNVGSGGAVALPNGNYVVISDQWNGEFGAVTWGNGMTGIKGVVSATNSLVGSKSDSFVGSGGVTILTTGNYVVSSPTGWDTVYKSGAVTWCDASVGRTGVISTTNSLMGSANSDQVGSGGVIALTNGNYVVSSPIWNNPDSTTTFDVGAVTWCSSTGVVGVVSAANSLVGSMSQDQVGSGGVTALTNGHYVVSSPGWDGAAVSVGAVTWCNGSTGRIGVVSAANSLVGSTLQDRVGIGGAVALNNGNYVVISPLWDGAAVDVGALTWCNGSAVRTGVVSAANSLVGSAGNQVGSGSIRAYSDGNYVVYSPLFDGTSTDVGAVTLGLGNGSVVGAITVGNSVLGSSAGNGANLVFTYSVPAQNVFVGRRDSNMVSIFGYNISGYTVAFDANTGTGTMPVQNKVDNVELTLSSNIFTKTDHIFAGWNTAANGSGTAYANGATYTANAPVTLYAQWTRIYTVTFNRNGNGSGTMAAQTKIHDVDLTLPPNSYTRTGAIFAGWNTAANGSGTAYANGATYTANAAVTLFAQWTSTYTVTFNKNSSGASGTMTSQTKINGVNLTLSANTFTRTGYTFTGWNTAANGSGTAYANGATYTANAAVTLYAQWTSTSTYTVSFNANNGTGTMAAQTKTHGVNLTLSANTFTRAGYSFTGWNTAAIGSGTAYANGATYTANATVTLHAQWTITNNVTITAADAAATEGPSDTATFTFTRQSSVGSLTVNYVVDGVSTATPSDYTLSGSAGQVTFADGASTATVTLTAIAEPNNLFEPSETVQLTITAGAGYQLGAPSAATASIAANGYHVISTANSGPGSLRQAFADVAALSGSSIITLDPVLSGQTITLTSEIAITDVDGVTLDATSLPAGLTISGGGINRMFRISNGANVTLRSLTLSGGTINHPDSGGAIYNINSTLTLERCTFVSNTASATFGGALHNIGNGNHTVTITRCTFTGNSAIYGGAISCDGGPMQLNHCTIAGNSAITVAGTGGGIYNINGSIQVNNTIVANNTAPLFPDLSTVSNPLIGGGNYLGTNPTLLWPLGQHGGPTPTMPLRLGSAARDAATPSASTTDQRGYPMFGTPDIGAYEGGDVLQNYAAWALEAFPGGTPTPDQAQTADIDGDGTTNLMEFYAQTDPLDAQSAFATTLTTPTASTMRLSFPTAPQRRYRLQESTDLGVTPFANSAEPARTGDGTVKFFDAPMVGSRNFYRIQIEIIATP